MLQLTLVRDGPCTDNKIEQRAFWSLCKLKEKNSEDLALHRQALVQALKDPSPELRRAAVKALGSLEHRAVLATPNVGQVLLTDPSDRVRDAAAKALGDVASEAAVDYLVQSLRREKSSCVRGTVAFTLYKLCRGDAVPGLLQGMQDPDETVRKFVVMSLCELGPAAGDAVPTLVLALSVEKSRKLRDYQQAALRNIGLTAEAVPLLEKMVSGGDSSTEVRCRGAKAAGLLGHATPDIPEISQLVDALVTALNADQSGEVRACVAWALGSIGSGAAEARSLDCSQASQDPVLTATCATVATNCFGPAKSEITECRTFDHDFGLPLLQFLPALEAALIDQSAKVRRASAEAIGGMGHLAEPALATLAGAFEAEDNREVQRSLAWALGRIGPAAVVALRSLVKAFEDSKSGSLLRCAVADAIGDMGEAAAEAGTMLIEALDSQDCVDDDDLHRAIIRALGCIQCKEAAQRLLKLLRYPSASAEASKALVRICDAHPALLFDLIDSVIEIFSDERLDKGSRFQAGAALASFGPKSVMALQQLEMALQCKDWEVQLAAVRALGSMGRAAAHAVPKLNRIACTGELHHRVVDAAAKAVVQIGEADAAVRAHAKSCLQKECDNGTPFLVLDRPHLPKLLTADDRQRLAREALSSCRGIQSVAHDVVCKLLDGVKVTEAALKTELQLACDEVQDAEIKLLIHKKLEADKYMCLSNAEACLNMQGIVRAEYSDPGTMTSAVVSPRGSTEQASSCTCTSNMTSSTDCTKDSCESFLNRPARNVGF